MRRVIPGFKSETERDRRRVVREERVEALEASGVPTGGFGDSIYDRMSPGLRRAIAESEAEEAYQAARAERERAYRAEQWAQRSEDAARQDAIREAIEAGEDASPRALRGEQLGHEPSEFVALMSARQDVEDMQLEAEKARARRRWEAQYDAGNQGDLSAPTQRQLDEQELMQERARRYRAREHDAELIKRGIPPMGGY